MVQLEKIYLLNVLIYINEIHSTRRFLEINKKCREVGNMLRIYVEKKTYDQKNYHLPVNYNMFIPIDVYDLFPTIETIECNYDKGWTLVTVNGISLGWGKAQSGILKNHYPKGLRRG